MRYLIFVTVITVFLATLASGQSAKSGELTTVKNVDLKRYAGKWYEIAKYPNRFQKQCIGDTTATYTLKDGGKIEVLNACRTKDGTVTSALGEGKIGDAQTNSKLKVRFAPGFISWLPFVWADYWILDLGKDYEYVMIGEPGRDYFWILSRTPEMDDAKYKELLDKAKAMGFDPAKVQKTMQATTN
jgi:apolipoprotein D and lipocalin family protein